MSSSKREGDSWISDSEVETEQFGAQLGRYLQSGDLICLSGDLGAGKTAMARGVGRGWTTPVRVTSPTFTLMNEYPRSIDNLILYHLDCYRLGGEAEVASEFEVESTGLPDLLLSEHVILIEWAERVAPYLPAAALWIQLAYLDEGRRQITLQGVGPRMAELARVLLAARRGPKDG